MSRVGEGRVVARVGDYRIEKIYEGKGQYSYSAYSDEGELALGGRDSLEEMRVDLSDWLEGGGEEGSITYDYQGKPVTISDEGGYISRGVSPLDESVEGLVLRLNSEGLATIASCSGHLGRGGNQGFVQFGERLQSNEKVVVRKIVQEYGLQGIHFEDRYSGTRVWFDAID